MSEALAAAAASGRPWARAFAWLAFLGPFFFATYGFATWATAQRPHVGALVFDWERTIPFLPWTIVPYWSIDLLYGLSLFTCTDRRELDTHAKRLLTAQVVAVCCFLLFPLTFTFERPVVDGIFGWLFEVPGALRQAVQPGAFAARRAAGDPLGAVRARRDRQRLALRSSRLVRADRRVDPHDVAAPFHRYSHRCVAGIFLRVAVAAGRGRRRWRRSSRRPTPRAAGSPRVTRWGRSPQPAWRLRWAAQLCGCCGSLWRFRSSRSTTRCLVLPDSRSAAGVSRSHRRRCSRRISRRRAPMSGSARAGHAPWAHVADDVWIGRLPHRGELESARFDAHRRHDVRASGLRRSRSRTRTSPFSISRCPDPATIDAAVQAIERRRAAGRVLVCCALGYSRSATAAAAWLVATGRAPTPTAAAARIRTVRPQVVLTDAHLAAIAAAAAPNRADPADASAALVAGVR